MKIIKMRHWRKSAQIPQNDGILRILDPNSSIIFLLPVNISTVAWSKKLQYSSLAGFGGNPPTATSWILIGAACLDINQRLPHEHFATVAGGPKNSQL
jgi:hypothetical protein